MFYVLAPGDATAHLQISASQQLSTAFRPATFRAYTRMFRDFLAFLSFVSLSLPQVATHHILAFMEYLHQSGLSPSNITNYVTAIRSMYIIHACDTSVFRDQRLPLFIKCLKINRNLQPVLPVLLDQKMLTQLTPVIHFNHLFFSNPCIYWHFFPF